MKWIVPLVLIGIFVFICLFGFIFWVSYNNRDVDIRNQAKAQQKANEVIYDKVWKILQQKAGILDKYASDFKEIYTNIMSERYEGETKQAPLFKFVTEHNPNFSAEMYKDLSDAIEAQRTEFAMCQNRLIDIKREHDNLRLKFPGSIILSNKAEIEIKIVTSTKTERTFETGKEDDIDLFKK